MREARGPLFGEHALLGAQLADDGQPIPVLSYAGAGRMGEGTDGQPQCGLADLTGMVVMRVGGEPAPMFVHTACAAAGLEMGRCAPSAVLAGDGALVGIPLVARTGLREYVILDATPRGQIVADWLGFLSAIEQDGVAPYAGLEVEDATDVHIPLLLSGPAAPDVLSDYLVSGETPLAPGLVGQYSLDGHLACVAMALPGLETPTFLLMTSPAHAVVLWRSLLSFASVVPLGRDALLASLLPSWPWLPKATASGQTTMAADELLGFGLARRDATFVGARALFDVEGGSDEVRN